MQESFKFGLATYWCDYKTICFERYSVQLKAFLVLDVRSLRRKDDFIFAEGKEIAMTEFAIIHFRVDPPVTDAYRYPLQLLEMGVSLARRTGGKTIPLILNPPCQILMDSEKLMQSTFPDHFPETIVTSDWLKLSDFGRIHGKTVLKPIGGTQSLGVEVLEWKSDSAIAGNRRRLELASATFSTPVLLQSYLKGVEKEEIRLWFVDGSLVASIKKIARGNFIFNIDGRESTVESAELTTQQMSIAKLLSADLKERNIFTAAIDLIDDKIIDYNITCPGLIVHMEKILGQNLAYKIMDAQQGLLTNYLLTR